MEKTIIEYEGHKYEMGASFSEVKNGDIIEVRPGRLEVITSVFPLRDLRKVSVHTNF